MKKILSLDFWKISLKLPKAYLIKIDEASKEYGLLHSQCIKTFLSYIFLKASFFCSFVSE